MERIKSFFEIGSIILLVIVAIFYRDNYMAVYSVTILMLVRVFIKVLEKYQLPKAEYYIKKPVIHKIFMMAVSVLMGLAFIKYVLLLSNGHKYNESDGFMLIIIPLMMLNNLDGDRCIYFYDKGLVWEGNVIPFDVIYSFNWQEDDGFVLSLSCGKSKYKTKVPQKMYSEVNKRLEAIKTGR